MHIAHQTKSGFGKESRHDDSEGCASGLYFLDATMHVDYERSRPSVRP